MCCKHVMKYVVVQSTLDKYPLYCIDSAKSFNIENSQSEQNLSVQFSTKMENISVFCYLYF